MVEKMIYQKMANIMKKVSAISKGRTSQQGYKFRGIDEVMNGLHDIFAEEEVFILPWVKEFTTELRQTKNGGIQTYVRATVTHRYITVDGSFVETVTVGEAMDSSDKSMSKAISIALKYSLLQMLLIPTDEPKDPDEFKPEETDFLQFVETELDACNTAEELMEVWGRYPAMQGNATFKAMFTKKKKQINK